MWFDEANKMLMPFRPQPRSTQTHGPASPPTVGAARIGHEDWHPNVIKFNGKGDQPQRRARVQHERLDAVPGSANPSTRPSGFREP